MKDKKEKESNMDEINVENNTTEDVKVKKKNKKSWLLVLLVSLVGAILLFTLTSYRLLFSPTKITFLGQITTDIGKLDNFIENIEKSKILSFISGGVTKDAKIDFLVNSKKISGQIIADKDYFAINLDDITQNYLLLENKKINELLSKFGFESEGVLSEIDFNNNPFSFTNSEKRKIYSFITNCTTNIAENLEKENFILNENVTFASNDRNLSLRSAEVQLSESDIFMVQKEALLSLQNEGVLNMLINKLNKIDVTETIDKKEIKDEIEKYIAYLDYAKAYYDLEENENEYYIIYKMYYDENGVVAREIIEKYTYEGKIYEDVICRLITDSNGYYEIKWFTQEDYSSAYYSIISDKITMSDNKQNHEIKYSVDGFYVGEAEDDQDYQYIPVNGEMIYNVVLETLENGDIKAELIDPNNLYKFNLNYIDNKLDLDFATKYDEFDIETKLSLKNTEITQEELLNNGAMLINDKTQEELITEFIKIGSKLSEIFSEE
ncbi:MAG: hypothetical protein E7314_00090 [Clostridiales bacterium]|nr:hypothetical protein [Clostridiales bacterium]